MINEQDWWVRFQSLTPVECGRYRSRTAVVESLESRMATRVPFEWPFFFEGANCSLRSIYSGTSAGFLIRIFCGKASSFNV